MSLFSVLSGKKVKFNVTSKNIEMGKNFKHIWPHLTIIGLTLLGIAYNIVLIVLGYHPTPSGFAANAFWCLFNIVSLSIMVRAAYWKHEEIEAEMEESEVIQTQMAPVN